MANFTDNMTQLQSLLAKVNNLPEASSEDISTETTEYTAQLDELEEVIDSLPDAGSGGGGAIETCTVVLSKCGADTTIYRAIGALATIFDGNNITTFTNMGDSWTGDLVIENAVIGSIVSIEHGSSYSPESLENVSLIYSGLTTKGFKIEAPVGGVARISYPASDGTGN